MKNDYLLSTEAGMALYEQVKDLPIIDYHCHLSPKEIAEDKVFDNIGQMWLEYDHYKWRLMRAAGIDEEFVTGNAPWKDKFKAFASCIEWAAGNPLYHWTQMELAKYFGIREYLTPFTAEDIWNRANKVIEKEKLSPRKLISKSKVEYIATTDDIADTLEYHKVFFKEKAETHIRPSFRTDKLLLIKQNYKEYINVLSEISEMEITCFDELLIAVCKRLDCFVFLGCKFTDMGIEFFPTEEGNFQLAANTFERVLNQKEISDSEYNGFLGYMLVFLGKEYAKRNLVMQWHLGVRRNANKSIFEKCGGDSGVDCIGNAIEPSSVVKILNAIEESGGLPKTIIYSLNPVMNPMLTTVTGSFRNVVMGPAWWFCDTHQGIIKQLEMVAELGYLGRFPGMLTDSRSFLSYTRHDYYRRILCSLIGKWVEEGLYSKKSAVELVKKLCYSNIRKAVL